MQKSLRNKVRLGLGVMLAVAALGATGARQAAAQGNGTDISIPGGHSVGTDTIGIPGGQSVGTDGIGMPGGH